MAIKKISSWTLVFMILWPVCLMAQEEAGTISYKINGKLFTFNNGRMEYYKDDGYFSLTCKKTQWIADPAGTDQKLPASVGMTIQYPGDEGEFSGTHQANSSDQIPTYFFWYDIVPAQNKKGKALKNMLAGLDSGDENVMVINLTVENFGPPGSLVQGTFNGKLFDEDGKLYRITDGRFSVPRKDMQ
jgi:hypothetical protein